MMRKLWIRSICVGLLGAFVVTCAAGLRDKKTLREDLIRLHVVANSDTQADQDIKLRVRDAVIAYLEPALAQFQDSDAAKQYIQEHLAELAEVANRVLAGTGNTAAVTLTKEAFPLRVYDTFRLPSGVYESLRVTIGSGAGHNWWCVVFPSLCIPASSSGFEDAAVEAGMSSTLTQTLSEEQGYSFHFFVLDCLGKIENFFFTNG